MEQMRSPQFLDRSLYVGIIEKEGARVSDVARSGPLDGRVPHMRRWKMADVVAHLGGVHRWAAEIVSTGEFFTVSRRRGEEQGDALIAWFDEGVAHLTSVLGAADPDARCPNFSPGSPDTNAFWSRRQAHETTMHRWDTESAAGKISPIDPVFATDGIDELFSTFTRSRGKQVLPSPVAITCVDTGASWTAFPADKPGRVDFARDRDQPAKKPVATIAGDAENLLLALWKRVPVGRAGLKVTGRTAVAEAFLAGPLSP